MRIVIFSHSLVSDWNHGNAHFLRGIASELVSRNHDVRVYEPEDSWSRNNLIHEQGDEPIREFHRVYPRLESRLYDRREIDPDRELEGAQLVIVHEWNDPELVAAIGAARKRSSAFRLLFHDTHHRSVTDPQSMSHYDLSAYDGVLAFGEAVRNVYLRKGWTRRAWVWHEAADTRVFHPIEQTEKDGDLVWIGNWGDDERSREIREFLIDPAAGLQLSARIYGVRYPEEALALLRKKDIRYAGWLPNVQVPEVFSRFRVTVHIPRAPYRSVLPGIPTIRVFEALACGIPLISAPWEDRENLFTPGR